MVPYEELDLTNVRTYSARNRASKVQTDIEAGRIHAGMSFRQFLDALPKCLKADDLRHIARAVVSARRKKKPVIAMLGGHVIKTGCATVLIDLVREGFLSHVASNGAAAIHDTELARFGHTSEDVAAQLTDGSFGMAADTAELVNRAAERAARMGEGFGESVGALLDSENPPYLDRTLIHHCYRYRIPYTLHVAIGTDIVHQHPSASGASIGEASHRDFRIFAAAISRLGGGGVVLNLGSAVLMPEVFLKALSVARNLGYPVTDFVTANLDMFQHYRPMVNVVHRPVLAGGSGYAVTGHHEILIPLLAAAVYEYAG